MRKKWWILIIVVVLAGAGAAGWYFFWPKSSTTNESQKPTTSAEIAAKVVTDAQEVAKKDPQAAYDLIDQEIKKTDNKEVQSSLYLGKADIALGDKAAGPATALEYALQADETDATSASAAYIASLYEAKKDIPNAIKYYQLAYDREPEVVTSGSGGGKSNAGLSKRPMYKAIIENLKNG